jgi:hypothetical protein
MGSSQIFFKTGSNHHLEFFFAFLKKITMTGSSLIRLISPNGQGYRRRDFLPPRLNRIFSPFHHDHYSFISQCCFNCFLHAKKLANMKLMFVFYDGIKFQLERLFSFIILHRVISIRAEITLDCDIKLNTGGP